MKRGKRTFPSLFTFYSQFAALHRVSRDIPVTTSKAVTLSQSSSGYADTAQAVLPECQFGAGWIGLPRLLFVLLLQLAKVPPTGVLPGFGGIGSKIIRISPSL